MATQAHCAYCFEALAASFERRQPLSLARVEELWEQYNTGKGVQDQEDDEDEDGSEVDGEEQESSTVRPVAITRLLNHSTNPSTTSSSSSLPSSTKSTGSSSASSTQQSASASGTVTPASSRSSLFSSNSQARSQRREDHPLFVTWNVVSRSGHKTLRGCIGTFEAQELEHGLKSYALTSAFEDVRFQPIPASLLPSLSAHVTLLTNFSSPTRDPLDWTLGQHGLRISFTYHMRRYGATYLPDVAKEQGWTKEETLVSLMRKAGWNGSSSAWMRTWKDGKGELVRYEGRQIGLGYPEWKAWREWVTKMGVKSQPLN